MARQPALFTEHPRRPRGYLRRATDAQLAALRAAGRLDEAGLELLVALERRVADVADELRDDPDARYHFNAAVKLLAELDQRVRGLGGPDVDAFADLLAAAAAGGTAAPGHPSD